MSRRWASACLTALWSASRMIISSASLIGADTSGSCETDRQMSRPVRHTLAAATPGAAWRAACLHSTAQRTFLASESGRRLDAASSYRERKQLQLDCKAIVQAAPQYQQAGVLTRIKRIRRVGSGAK